MRMILLPVLIGLFLPVSLGAAQPGLNSKAEARDDAAARERAFLRRHGGAPDHTYLVFKQQKAAQELAGGSTTIPSAMTSSNLGSLSGPAWRPLGPSRQNGNSPSPELDAVAGRPTAILTHPTSASTLYVAFCGGGVWKSTNADPAAAGDWTWTCLTDNLPSSSAGGNVSVGDLAMEPGAPETLYMGMGDPIGIESTGFFYSTNGGASWTLGGSLGDSTAVYRILAIGNGTLVVATRSASGPGLYRSTDGGRSFTPISPLPDPHFSIRSLVAFSSGNLAAAGTTQNPDGSLRLVFCLSRNGGLSWSTALSPSTLLLPNGIIHRINPEAVALAVGPGGVGYGLVGDLDTGRFAEGLLINTTYGYEWTFRPTSGLWTDEADGRQDSYNAMITVDPQDARKVFVAANVGVHRSFDGGSTWQKMTDWSGYQRVWTHADTHLGVWSKTGTPTLYVGNDGGLSVFRDPYRQVIPQSGDYLASDVTFVDNRRNKGLQTHLLYSVGSTMAAIPGDAQDRVVMGLQDNCTNWRIDTGSGMKASMDYKLLLGTGDGQDAVIHPLDGSRLIAASYLNNINSLSGVGSDGSIGSIGSAFSCTVGEGSTFFTQVVPVPSDVTGNTVLTADSHTVYQSSDFGITWAPRGRNGLDPAVEIRRLAVSSTNGDIMAVSAAISNVTDMTGYYTLDGGASWTRFGAFPSTGSSPASAIWGISVGSTPNVLYATSEAFHQNASHLWRSVDAGATWTPLDGSPAAPNGYPYGIPAGFLVESRMDPSTLFVGTEFGLYWSRNSGATWSRLGSGLPLTQVQALWEAPDGSKLRVATYGRGAWEFSRVAVQVSPIAATVSVGHNLHFSATVFNSANQAVTWSVEGDGGTITPDGTFTADTLPWTCLVRATSQADPTRSSAATVSVVALPAIQGFSAAQSVITQGNTTALLPTFSGGQGSIVGLGPVLSGQAISTGPLQANTDFTLVVTNAAGDTVSTAITVKVVPPPVIKGFSAVQSHVYVGESATLKVDFQGGTGEINSIGPVSSGTLVTTPPLQKTTDFTLKVTNDAGTVTMATVRVYALIGGPQLTVD
jgi:hypothetical protein